MMGSRTKGPLRILQLLGLGGRGGSQQVCTAGLNMALS
jgi:hypothetical protein